MSARSSRCPFTAARVPRDAMVACPGFAPDPFSDLSISGRRVPRPATCCAHLAGDRIASGRYVPGCHHPEAARVIAAARDILGVGLGGALHDAPLTALSD